MAKISARGDVEVRRWRHPETGAELVLTRKGRLLYKWQAGASFTLLRSILSVDALAIAGEEAARRGMEVR